jgi:uncharacterized protein
MRFIKITLTLALLCTVIFAQQKDCKKASTNMERLVCSNAELSGMDKKIEELYNRIKASYGVTNEGRIIDIYDKMNCTDSKCLEKLHKAQDNVITDQEEFESKKKSCTDIECLKRLYKAYIPVLAKKAEAAEAEAKARELEKKVYEEKSKAKEKEITRNLIIAALIGLFLLVCYIIAFVKLKRGDNIVPVAGWFDIILMFLAVILIPVGAVAVANSKDYFVLALVVGSLCFLGSIAFSIVKNKGNPFNIIVSIFAKLFLVFISLIIITLIKFAIKANRSQADKGQIGRWEEGAKNTAALTAGVGMLTFLSLGLIKR